MWMEKGEVIYETRVVIKYSVTANVTTPIESWFSSQRAAI